MPSPPPTPKTSHEVETILVQLQLRVQTLKDTNSKKKTVAKGKLETKNKELAFTFELTEANYLSFLSALLKEHGFGKYTPVKKQHGFGIKVGMGAKKAYVWTPLLCSSLGRHLADSSIARRMLLTLTSSANTRKLLRKSLKKSLQNSRCTSVSMM